MYSFEVIDTLTNFLCTNNKYLSYLCIENQFKFQLFLHVIPNKTYLFVFVLNDIFGILQNFHPELEWGDQSTCGILQGDDYTCGKYLFNYTFQDIICSIETNL